MMEHHSNMVPWQLLAKEKGARIEYAPITPDGRLDMAEFERLLGLSPSLVAFTQCSNVLGTINDAEKLCSMAKRAGATTVVDAAQSAPAHAGRRPEDGLRLPRVLRAQDARPHGDRRALREEGAC